MLIRVVRMEFKPSKTDAFLDIFHSSVDRIRSSEGCQQVQLKKDPKQSNVYYTHSVWESELYLNAYRNSEFFGETWSKTKKLFIAKPQAFSLVDP